MSMAWHGMAWLNFALEYQAGIADLSKQSLWVPAHALLRTLYSSCLRGAWFVSYAQHDAVEHFGVLTLTEKIYQAQVDYRIAGADTHTSVTASVLADLRKLSGQIFGD